MDEDMTALDGTFSPLSVDSSLGALDSSYDFTSSAPVSTTTAAPPSTNSSATGAVPTAGVSGFQSVLNTLTSAFTGGVNAYNVVAQKTGLPLANGTPTAAVPVAVLPAPVLFGLTQQQLLFVGGGVAVVALLFLVKKR